MNLDIGSAQDRLADANKRLAELKGVAVTAPKDPATATVLTPAATAKRPGFKTIYKKDGTTIQAQSMISMDKEVRYKDEAGKWQTINSSDVDKVE